MTKTMAQQLYQVECDPACGFLVRNHNETEIVPIVIAHCLNTHNKVLSADEARKSVKRL